MSESITDRDAAVRMLGALPEPSEPEVLRAKLAELKATRADEHDDLSAAVGYTSGLAWSDLVGIAATNTTSLVQAERDVRALRARVAELESERHVTNEALDDAAKVLREQRDRIAVLEERPTVEDVVVWLRHWSDVYYWTPGRSESGAAVASLAERLERGEGAPPVERSADRLTRMLAPTQALREGDEPLRGRALLDALAVERAEATHWQRLGVEDPHDSPLHHDYRVGRDLPESGGA